MSKNRITCAVAWLTILVACDSRVGRISTEQRSNQTTAPRTKLVQRSPKDGIKVSCASKNAKACLRDCNAGRDSACDKLTSMYLRGDGVAKSKAAAAALSKRLCESGRKYFCPSYAFVLAQGFGISRDLKRARQLFIESCRHDPTACWDYGRLYLRGRGVSRNVAFGRLLLQLACKAKHAKACRDLQTHSR